MKQSISECFPEGGIPWFDFFFFFLILWQGQNNNNVRKHFSAIIGSVCRQGDSKADPFDFLIFLVLWQRQNDNVIRHFSAGVRSVCWQNDSNADLSIPKWVPLPIWNFLTRGYVMQSICNCFNTMLSIWMRTVSWIVNGDITRRLSISYFNVWLVTITVRAMLGYQGDWDISV